MAKRNSSDEVQGSLGEDRLLEEAEGAVLGAVLLAGSIALPAIQEEGLTAEDFSRSAFRRIFAAMLVMHEAGEPVDTLTLADRLQRDGALREVGGRLTIDTLHCPSAAHLRQYARMVVRASMWRRRGLLLQYGMDACGSRDEGAFRAALADLRRCELRFRPLLERDLATP